MAIYANYLACEEGKLKEILYQFITKWKAIMPVTSGHHLRARGLRPGPIYRRILHRLREAWIDGQITSAEQEQQYLEELLTKAEESD